MSVQGTLIRSDRQEFTSCWNKYRALGGQWVSLAEAMTETDRLQSFYKLHVDRALPIRCTDAMARDRKIAAPLVVEFLQDILDVLLDRAS